MTNLINAVTVSIGRNVGTVPMSALLWESYKIATRNIMNLALQRPVDFVVDGQGGEWEGTPEESAILTTLAGDDGFNADQVNGLRQMLKWLLRDYHQDAVAVHVGNSALVTAPVLEAVA